MKQLERGKSINYLLQLNLHFSKTAKSVSNKSSRVQPSDGLRADGIHRIENKIEDSAAFF